MVISKNIDMKGIKFLLGVLLIANIFAACDDAAPEVYNGPSLASFLDSKTTIYALEGSTQLDTIKLGITTISEVERRVAVEVETTGSATEGVHFTIASEAVFPANSSIGYVTIKGEYDKLAQDGPQDIIIKLNGTSDVQIAGWNNTFNCRLSQYCPLVIDQMAGEYDVVYEWWFEDANVHDAVVTVVDDYTLNIVTGGLDFNVVLDDTDPANFNATVAPQVQWVYGGAHDVFIQGDGSFSACDQTITLRVQHAMPSYPYAWGFDECALVKR